MKMGTIVSPCPFDLGTCHSIQLARLTAREFALRIVAGIFPISQRVRLPFDGGSCQSILGST